MLNGLAVGLGGITFVFVPCILRIFGGNAVHKLVAVCLGKYRCSGNAAICGVAFHDTCGRNVVIWLETVSVNEDSFRTYSEAVEGAMHGEYRGVENVDFVDFGGCYHSYAPCQCFLLDYWPKGVTLVFGELFRIVEQRVVELVGEYDSGSKHRSGEATAAGFVASGLNSAILKKW